MELGYARQLNKPTLLTHHKDRRVSRMISGLHEVQPHKVALRTYINIEIEVPMLAKTFSKDLQ